MKNMILIAMLTLISAIASSAIADKPVEESHYGNLHDFKYPPMQKGTRYNAVLWGFESDLDAVEGMATYYIQGSRPYEPGGEGNWLAKSANPIQSGITAAGIKDCNILAEINIMSESLDAAVEQYKKHGDIAPMVLSTRRMCRIQDGGYLLQRYPNCTNKAIAAYQADECVIKFDLPGYYIKAHQKLVDKLGVKASKSKLKDNLLEFAMAVQRIRVMLKKLEATGYWDWRPKCGLVFEMHGPEDGHPRDDLMERDIYHELGKKKDK